VAARFGRSLLELGGNNAAIVTPSADLDLAVRAITVRCLWARPDSAARRLRRLIVHRSRHDELVERLGVGAFASCPSATRCAPARWSAR
jgi:aldehyde dehydrogenase (NAD+)